MPDSNAPLRPRLGTARNGRTLAARPSSLTAARGPAAPPATPWLVWLICVAPALTAFSVAMYRIAAPSLWRDEAYTIEAASRSPAQILALLGHSDAVHGAYYMCMHVVIMVFGSSETAVRTPSAVATAATAGMLALLGRRLAASSGGQWPNLSGLISGLLYAVAPLVTRYAQEARSYATVACFAVAATYLLVRGLEDGRRRWWAGYAVAVSLTGLFNLFGLLLVPAHAVTVLAAGRGANGRIPGATGHAPASGADGHAPAPGAVRSWAVAAISAVVLLIPVAIGGYIERGQTSWLGQPGRAALSRLGQSFAGSGRLMLPVGALVVVAASAGLAAVRRYPLTPASVALPWLALPLAALLAVSQIHPVYNLRYVVFCLPTVALLAADGLGWLAWLTSRLTAGLTWRLTARPGVRLAAPSVLAWLPSLAVITFIGVSCVAPQQALRNPWSRPDYLRKVSRIVASHARSGDAVLYIPLHSRIVSQGYPAPFHPLADIALARSPIAAATLNGTEVSPQVLRGRFAAVCRVWVISDDGPRLPKSPSGLDQEKLALVHGMRRIASWHTRNDLLLLYARPGTARFDRCRRAVVGRLSRSRGSPADHPRIFWLGSSGWDHPVADASPVRLRCAASCARSLLRPLCSRDITVPMGVPMIVAISLYAYPSTSAR